jgi:REP element-mobilizing transposase RayT
MEHSHLRRLDRVWIQNPFFFITICTNRRRKILANAKAAEILLEEWKSAKGRHDWYIGRYVIMPDHVHFFYSPGNEAKDISIFMKCWKEWSSKKLKSTCNVVGHVWQKEFFDHLLRSDESYSEKCEYVLNCSCRSCGKTR